MCARRAIFEIGRGNLRATDDLAFKSLDHAAAAGCFRPLRGVMMLDAPSTPYRGRLRMRSRGPALGIQLSQPKHLVELH